MANRLSTIDQDKIRSLFLSCQSIKAVAKTLGVSKNTVKRLLRAEGLSSPLPIKKPPVALETTINDFEPIDFSILEKLFEMGREQGENLDFQKHIKAIAESMAREIGISGTVDKIRLESAITHYIAYRRFYIKSLSCSDKRYEGPFSRSHEKLAKAVLSFVDASNKSFDQFNRLIRELEVKYQKRSPDFGKGNIFLNHGNVAVRVGG